MQCVLYCIIVLLLLVLFYYFVLLQAQQGLLDKSKEPFSIRAKKFFPVEKAEWVGLFESTVNIEMNKFNFYFC